MGRSLGLQQHLIKSFDASQIVANGGINYTIPSRPVPDGRLVRRLFLRVRSDLVLPSSTARLALMSQVTRRNLFNALVSSVAITMPGHPMGDQIVQSQGLGELVESYGRLGVFPVCPNLFGEGQYFGEVAQKNRMPNITPAGINGSMFVSMQIPLVDQRFQKAGNSYFLAPERLAGVAINLTLGTFTFNDLNSMAVTFPNGSGSAAGVTCLELVAETVPNNTGGSSQAWPPIFTKINNGTQSDVTLNPQGGAVALAIVRIPTLGANDSVDYITRTYAFTNATSLSSAQQADFNPMLKVDGKQASDITVRGFEDFTGLDLIVAQADAVATAHQLRATDNATVGDGYDPPSFYNDSGVPLVWNSPDENFFEGISFGLHQVTFPNQWVAIGDRLIYCVIFPILPGGADSKAKPESAIVAGRRGGSGIWNKILSILPGRT